MAWIQNAAGEVLMVRQRTGNQAWTLPGGKIKLQEGVERGLRREVFEETGLKVASAHFAAIYDRPEKPNVTILYKVKVKAKAGAFAAKNPLEIAEVTFWGDLPGTSSPSAAYFWGVMITRSAPSAR